MPFYGRHLIVTPTHEDIKYLKLARYIATEWSKDPSTKTGAVIVDRYSKIISMDCNRLPTGVDQEIIHDRPQKYKHIIHCEIAAAAGNNIRGCKLYTWPFMSCDVCAGKMGDMGIYANIAPYDENERWLEAFESSVQVYNNNKPISVNVRLIDPKLLD